MVIGRGRLLADTSVESLVAQAAGGGVRVGSPAAGLLATLLAGPDVTVTAAGAEQLVVSGLTARQISLIAAEHGIPLFELTAQTVSLEEAFMDLTRESVEYTSHLELAR
ncbi:hypothetical protein AMIS_35120 [Actinoplanes missouriensis 431]|uniref:ABC transporter ATP-binding protein n=1 Tax=Actinoplanes missouriensis (strain ATCC 14538 / DSM 43046 / CBS 188.64 / JCM 3121 / NBRC 102363 / NCIMB 12654 / NRRL B-3342 / UNCC 431) TaxID=512565 RepID=I0H6U5_ACTM4|nr:hypothetical protein [Actinoplanes missouriensis]BAL88732.1 hypothetical protein AMIS_35120 [Actinoplanes missouriensis 431]